MLAKQDSSTDEEETSGIEHEHSPNQSLTVRVKADSHTFLTSKSFQNRIKIVVRIVVESSTLTVAIDHDIDMGNGAVQCPYRTSHRVHLYINIMNITRHLLDSIISIQNNFRE